MKDDIFPYMAGYIVGLIGGTLATLWVLWIGGWWL